MLIRININQHRCNMTGHAFTCLLLFMRHKKLSRKCQPTYQFRFSSFCLTDQKCQKCLHGIPGETVEKRIVFSRVDNDVRRNSAHLIAGVKASLANCALGFKYFDVPEIWPCYQTPHQRVAQIFMIISPSRFSSGASPSLRAL